MSGNTEPRRWTLWGEGLDARPTATGATMTVRDSVRVIEVDAYNALAAKYVEASERALRFEARADEFCDSAEAAYMELDQVRAENAALRAALDDAREYIAAVAEYMTLGERRDAADGSIARLDSLTRLARDAQDAGAYDATPSEENNKS